MFLDFNIFEKKNIYVSISWRGKYVEPRTIYKFQDN